MVSGTMRSLDRSVKMQKFIIHFIIDKNVWVNEMKWVLL